MAADPIALQNRLASLLDAAHRDDRLRGEMARARREFFGADEPGYVDPGDERAMDAAAQRFAEWFLLERVSEVVGVAPLEKLGDPEDADAPLAGGLVGLYLVESAGDEPQVRDLEGGDRLTLAGMPVRLRPGDVLVGRLFPADTGAFVPSAAMTVLAGSPHLAVAFQRDVRRLALDRRLSQAELEHLVFQRWAAESAARTVGGEEPAPVERIEAELQTLFDRAGIDDAGTVTSISGALKDAGGRPGEVIGPLLDQLAFDTDVDLNRARELLVELSNSHLHTTRRRAAASPPESTPSSPTPRETPSPTPPAPPAPPADAQDRQPFVPRPDETLGERLARRLDEGLAASEDVNALFKDVERILGDPIDDAEPGAEDEVPSPAGADLEDGDLEPLVREFAWEEGPSAADEARLAEFVALQRSTPIPRTNIEYVEADDYLRFALQVWLASAPVERAAHVRGAFAIVERFHAWLVESQDIDLRERLGLARRILIDRADELQRASVALSGSDAPSRGPRPELARVLGRRGDELEIEIENGRITCWVDAEQASTGAVGEGDLLLGEIDSPDGVRGRFVGAVVVVPLEAEHLLG